MNFFKLFSSPCCVNVNHIFLELFYLPPTTSFKSSFNLSSSAFHGCTDLFANTMLVLFSCCIFWLSSVNSSSSFSPRLPPPPVFYMSFFLCLAFLSLQPAFIILQSRQKVLARHGQVLVKVPEIQSRFTEITLDLCDDFFHCRSFLP